MKNIALRQLIKYEMKTLRESAQQALEALENIDKAMPFPVGKQAITALREALAQPEQEPTQWRDMIVVSLVREGIDKHKARELADHFAAQRPWQGLTAEEILDLFDRNNVYGSKWIEFARTVEAKLKEKNDH